MECLLLLASALSAASAFDTLLFRRQLLDHFDASNNATWAQPYERWESLESGFARPFVRLSLRGEAGALTLAEARERSRTKRGAKVKVYNYRLSHRFYEDAQPTGNLSLDSLRFLSTSQALEDAVHFIREVIRGEDGRYEPIIAFGCSYPATLAGWLRAAYPNDVAGAVAFSPVFHARANFSDFPADALASLRSTRPKCADALPPLWSRVRAYSRSELEAKFNLCSLDGLSDSDVSDRLVKGIWSRLTYDIVEDLVQYWNWREVVSFCREIRKPTPERYLIKFMESRQSNGFRKGPSGCILPSELYKNRWPTGNDAELRCERDPCPIQRAWWWQKCSELGWFKADSTTSESFHFYHLQEFYDLCESVFGLDSRDVDQGIRNTNDLRGGANLGGRVTKLIVYNGQYDPWRRVSFPYPYVSRKRHIYSTRVSRKGHCPNYSHLDGAGLAELNSWL